MALKQRELINNRLKSLMLSDRVEGLETILTVIKSDAFLMLSNYMLLENGAIKLELDISDDGQYHLAIKATTNRLIHPGKMID